MPDPESIFAPIEDENEEEKAKTTIPEVLSYDEIDRFLLALEETEDLIAARMMLFGGLRVSEAANMIVRYVDKDRIALFVKEGKWGKDRWAPCDIHTVASARAYATDQKLRDEDFLLADGIRTVQRHITKAFKDAGIEWGPTCHTLRHTCATWQIDKGIPLEVVKNNLGHNDISTTQIYLHIDIRRRSRMYREAVRFGI